MIKVIKSLSTLFLVTYLVIFSPVINVASADSSLNLSKISDISVDKLTPQKRQQLQAIRQGRNREIVKVLDNPQLQKLSHYLHQGQNLEQALAGLELSTEQKNLINAIIEFTNLKLQDVVVDYSLLDVNQ
ncbi:MAG: hypothetical protein F6K62_08035 [Sphaerospermopsis sp. SIO1G2]|nr:hypothetical protein [Sphaerospermopsis sp. SIO1G2]